MNKTILFFLAAVLSFACGTTTKAAESTIGGIYELVEKAEELKTGDVVIIASYASVGETTPTIRVMTTSTTSESGALASYNAGTYNGKMPSVITLENVNGANEAAEFTVTDKTNDRYSNGNPFAMSLKNADGQFLGYKIADPNTLITFTKSYDKSTSAWQIALNKEERWTRTNVISPVANLQCYDYENVTHSKNGMFVTMVSPTIGNTVYYYRKIPTPQLTIGSVGYSTMYYGTLSVKVPEGVKAFTYVLNGNTLSVSHTFQAGEWIPKATAVITKGAVNTYDLEVKDSEETFDGENILKGFDTDNLTEGDGTFYMFANGSNGIGFYYGAPDGAAFTSKAHKAYICVPEIQAYAKAFVMLPPSDDATEALPIINEFTPNAASEAFTIEGRKTTTTTKGSIIIKEGRKFFIK